MKPRYNSAPLTAPVAYTGLHALFLVVCGLNGGMMIPAEMSH